MHDVKQALIVKQGSGSGPEIVEPLVKDFGRDLPLKRYLHAEPERLDFKKANDVDRTIGDRSLMVTSLYSPNDCRDMLKPADFLMHYYDDGKMSRFIDMYLNAGIDCLMTMTPPPMGDVLPELAKEKYGRDVVLMGGVDAVN